MSAVFIILIVAFPAPDNPMQNSTEIKDALTSHMSEQNMTKALGILSQIDTRHTHRNSEVPI